MAYSSMTGQRLDRHRTSFRTPRQNRTDTDTPLRGVSGVRCPPESMDFHAIERGATTPISAWPRCPNDSSAADQGHVSSASGA